MTKESTNQEYEAKIKETIQNYESDELVLFLDKNHPPNGIAKAIEMLKRLTPYTYNLIITALIPECANQYSFKLRQKNKIHFPFSLTFMAYCINRV